MKLESHFKKRGSRGSSTNHLIPKNLEENEYGCSDLSVTLTKDSPLKIASSSTWNSPIRKEDLGGSEASVSGDSHYVCSRNTSSKSRHALIMYTTPKDFQNPYTTVDGVLCCPICGNKRMRTDIQYVEKGEDISQRMAPEMFLDQQDTASWVRTGTLLLLLKWRKSLPTIPSTGFPTVWGGNAAVVVERDLYIYIYVVYRVTIASAALD